MRGKENWRFSTNKSPNLKNDAKYGQGYYWSLIGSRTWAFTCCQNQRPWMTLNFRTALYCTNDACFGTHHGNLKKKDKTHTFSTYTARLHVDILKSSVARGLKRHITGIFLSFRHPFCINRASTSLILCPLIQRCFISV